MTVVPHAEHSELTKLSATCWWGPSWERRSETRTVLERLARMSQRYSREPFTALLRVPRIGNRADDRVDGFHHLVDRGMTTEVKLGEHEILADVDLEGPAARRDEGDVVYVMLVLVENRLNHAHGTVGVVSSCAVFDG